MSARTEQPLAAALVDALGEDELDQLADLLAPRLQKRLSEQRADEWMNAREAAAYVRLGLSEIHRRAKARRIPAHQDVPGGKYAFKRSELDEWRAGQ